MQGERLALSLLAAVDIYWWVLGMVRGKRSNI